MKIETLPYHIIRTGLAITFGWIGVLIVTNPIGWGGYLSPWVIELLPISLSQAMIVNGIFDLVVAMMLLTDFFVWLAAALAALHLIIVLTVTGITDVTVRDIGLLFAAIALAKMGWPEKLFKR